MYFFGERIFFIFTPFVARYVAKHWWFGEKKKTVRSSMVFWNRLLQRLNVNNRKTQFRFVFFPFEIRSLQCEQERKEKNDRYISGFFFWQLIHGPTFGIVIHKFLRSNNAISNKPFVQMIYIDICVICIFFALTTSNVLSWFFTWFIYNTYIWGVFYETF